MAELICNDGTRIAVSVDTEMVLKSMDKASRRQSAKKSFEKLQFCHLGVEVDTRFRRVELRWRSSEQICLESPEEIRKIIKGLQSAVYQARDSSYFQSFLLFPEKAGEKIPI